MKVVLTFGFTSFVRSSFLSLVGKFSFASFGSSETILESVHATFGVDNLFFTSKEWVRGA